MPSKSTLDEFVVQSSPYGNIATFCREARRVTG